MKKTADNMTIREWREAYKAGELTDMCDAGWYDWFCRESSLANRLKRFIPLLNRITNDFVLDNFRVWFKNNCPCVGPLYDDIRFEPIDETKREDMYFMVSYKDAREKDTWSLYDATNIWGPNGAESPTFGAARAADIANFINNMKF